MMPKYAYSPDTGELIRADAPANWMGMTDVSPPEFNPQTHGCFWRGAAWEIVAPPPPTAEELAAIARAAADAAAKTAAKADDVVRYLRDHTPAECEAYVQAAVTDLASARQMLKKFAVALCALAKQSLR